MHNPRKQALFILETFDETKGYSNLLLNKLNNNQDYSYQDKRFISNLVYGVIENRLLLDYIIRKYSSIRLKKIHNSVLNNLRIGAYQIIFLDRVPDSAAVNEAVKITKKINFRSSGFVNAILRQISINKNNLPLPNRNEDIINYFSIKYSHSKWLVKNWIEDYGEEFTEKLLESNNKKPDISVRVNTIKISKNKLVKKLISKGFMVKESEYLDEALIISSGTKSIIDSDEFKNGEFIVQDVGSMLIAKLLNPLESDIVLDVCSAPGGKTTFLGQIMNNKGSIIARDIYGHKIDLIRKNCEKLGLTNVKTESVDGRIFRKEDANKFDKILLDAPCSGIGIIRRKPEIKYLKTEKDIIDLSKLQSELLDTNSKYLKKGGTLMYSTCSIDKKENEMVIKNFLENHNDFELISTNYLNKGNKEWIYLFPNVEETDGFFMCMLKKL